MNDERRNCTDCRHYRPSPLGSSFGSCQETGFHIIIERDVKYDSSSRCGSTGKLWEAKPVRVEEPKPFRWSVLLTGVLIGVWVMGLLGAVL